MKKGYRPVSLKSQKALLNDAEREISELKSVLRETRKAWSVMRGAWRHPWETAVTEITASFHTRAARARNGAEEKTFILLARMIEEDAQLIRQLEDKSASTGESYAAVEKRIAKLLKVRSSPLRSKA